MGKRKSERRKRKKRLKRQIKGLDLQKEKHLYKIETEVGYKDTTPRYWMGEIDRFENKKEERKLKLKRLKGK